MSEFVDPIPRGVAVVIRGDRVLLIRRRRAGRRYAVLPGGHVEPSESRENTAIRELYEETSLCGQVERLLWTRDDDGRSASYFLMCGVVGAPTLGGEEAERHTAQNTYDLVWAAAGDFDRYNVQPAAIRAPLTDLILALDNEPQRTSQAQ